jgi:hypothetical protein
MAGLVPAMTTLPPGAKPGVTRQNQFQGFTPALRL